MLQTHKRFLSIILLITFIIVLIFLLTKFYIVGESGFIKSRNLIEKEYHQADFKKIFLDGRANIHITQDDNYKIKVVASPEVLKNIDIRVKDETLRISYDQRDRALFYWISGDINIYINTKDVNSIEMLGEGKITSSCINTNNLKLIVNGDGQAIMNIDTNNFNANITGNSEIVVMGKSNNQEINITGNAKFDARDLLGENTKITIDGDGQVITDIENILVGAIRGNGTIKYLNDPYITESILGNGKIIQLENN